MVGTRIKLFHRLLFLCSFAVITLVGIVYGGGSGASTEGTCDSADAETYYFVTDAYSRQNLRPYVHVVWENIVSELKRTGIESPSISKDDVALVVADLNDDGRKDIIAIVARSMLFCGKLGRECSPFIFVSTDKGFRRVECCMNVNWEDFPIQILKQKNHGLRDMVLNCRFLVRFDGDHYCDQ